MKILFHNVYGGNGVEQAYGEPVLQNLAEPVVRNGGEPFKSCCNIEWGCNVCHVIAPSRSLAQPIVDWVEGKIEEPHWAVYDTLSYLVADMLPNRWNPSRLDTIAFRTMFPDGVAELFANSYAKDSCFLPKHDGIVRVLNNPWFHKDRNANERRLVEIAEDNGLRFALDRIDPIPPPDVLAREIALLNHGLRDPENVEPVRARLAASIAETMSDWGLVPTVCPRPFPCAAATRVLQCPHHDRVKSPLLFLHPPTNHRNLHERQRTL